jgi:hypothetical protein
VRYRPSPDFIIALVIIAALTLATAYIFGAIMFWESAKADEVTQRVTTYSHGPDISHCFAPDETRELWDCIRHEEVDSEEAD